MTSLCYKIKAAVLVFIEGFYKFVKLYQLWNMDYSRIHGETKIFVLDAHVPLI